MIAHCCLLPRYVPIFTLISVYACSDSHVCMIYSGYSLIHSSIVMIASILLVETRLRDLEGCYGFCHTFPTSNLTREADPVFRKSPFPKWGVTLRVFLSYFVYPFKKIKQKWVATPSHFSNNEIIFKKQNRANHQVENVWAEMRGPHIHFQQMTYSKDSFYQGDKIS